eukprot:TRINITY_DN11780_c0_g1_i1.p1 TRINITY_DN11780_c0_g1~~TRINITY_DN11780_c0_g1_i1.p1  ORF type:complete len:171 (-),score=11.41 TRINITY_DN11780_c0_g1_i1:113-625(-)
MCIRDSYHPAVCKSNDQCPDDCCASMKCIKRDECNVFIKLFGSTWLGMIILCLLPCLLCASCFAACFFFKRKETTLLYQQRSVGNAGAHESLEVSGNSGSYKPPQQQLLYTYIFAQERKDSTAHWLEGVAAVSISALIFYCNICQYQSFACFVIYLFDICINFSQLMIDN